MSISHNLRYPRKKRESVSAILCEIIIIIVPYTPSCGVSISLLNISKECSFVITFPNVVCLAPFSFSHQLSSYFNPFALNIQRYCHAAKEAIKADQEV
jgi:hypothetical protein